MLHDVGGNHGEFSGNRQLDQVFHALSDGTRRTLIARLSAGTRTVTELAEGFGISLPAVSKHIRVLESAGLLVRTVDGRIHRCSLAPGALRDAGHWLAGYRSFWEETLDSLADHVGKTRKSAGAKRV
jgi:DNA-binding transcriptional ArsR family regulator